MDKTPIFQEIKAIMEEYKDHFKESDPDLRIRERFVGTAAINPFIKYNSSPRGLMMSSHISQLLVLNKPEPRIIRTGLDEELGKFAIVKKVEEDVEVVDVIKRYSPLHDRPSKAKTVEYSIIYRKVDSPMLGILNIPRFNRLHPYFGFIYNIDKEYIESLTPGDIIPAGKILAWPNTYDPETGEYSFGVNLNTVYMSIDGVGEDGVIISESAAKKLGFTLIEHRAVSVKNNAVLLNIYGDKDNYKAFPDIDEPINKDSVLMAERILDEDYLPGLLSTEDIKYFNPIFDRVSYMKSPNGKVIDIKVYKSGYKKKTLPIGTDEQLEMYADMLIDYFKRIISIYEKYNKVYKQMNKQDLLVEPEFNEFLVRAYGIVESSKPNSKIKKMYRKDPIESYRVEIDVSESIIPTKGFKVTDLSASKGVIVQVWPDEDMPYDPVTGERAEIIMEPAATVSRLNISRLYERYFTAASRTAKRLIVDYIKSYFNKDKVSGKDIYKLSDDIIKDIFAKYVLEFVKLIHHKQYEIYEEAFKNDDLDSMRELLEEILDKEFYIFHDIENPKEAWEIVIDLENSIFRPHYGPVKYKLAGKEFTTKSPVLIAPTYIILLNKIADGLLSCSSAKLNQFGFPIGVSKAEKYNLPYRNSPVRTIGETEGRLYASYGGRKFVAELVDRGASPQTHEIVYNSVLTGERPGLLDKAVDREKHPYGTHKGLELFRTLLNSVGVDLKFTEDSRRYIDPTSLESIEEEYINLMDDFIDTEEEGVDEED